MRLDRDPAASPGRLAVALSGVVVALLWVTFFAAYISSWLPHIGGFALGAIARDGLAIVLVAADAIVALKASHGFHLERRHLWDFETLLALFAIWVFTLLPFSHPFVAALLAARNLVLYAAVAVAVRGLWARGLVIPRVVMAGMVTVGTAAAILGILDTMTHGGIVTALGYRGDYSGISGSAQEIVAGAQGNVGGMVRASGGISNALVFAYVMVVLAILALSWTTAATPPRPRTLSAVGINALAVLAIVAAIASLTRGAWLALVAGVIVLMVTGFRRRTVFTVGMVAVSALAITVIASPFIPTGSTGSAGGGGPSSSPQPGDTGSSGAVGVITGRVGSSDKTSQASALYRVDELRAGLAQLAAHPLGTGLASEGAASDRAGQARQNLVPDIYLLIVGLPTGVPGLVLWLCMLGVVGLSAAREHSRPGGGMVLAALAVMAIASVLSSSQDAPVFALVAWLAILVFPAWWNAGPGVFERSLYPT